MLLSYTKLDYEGDPYLVDISILDISEIDFIDPKNVNAGSIIITTGNRKIKTTDQYDLLRQRWIAELRKYYALLLADFLANAQSPEKKKRGRPPKS